MKKNVTTLRAKYCNGWININDSSNQNISSKKIYDSSNKMERQFEQ